MFIQNKESTLPEGKLIDNQTLFDQLFTYIEKNKSIRPALEGMKKNPEAIQKSNELLLAINEGDANSTIFEDPQCDLYLLYLIQENHIPFFHGMTVYIYLIALMQFTDKQSLKQSDLHFKSKRELKIVKLSIDGCLSKEGAEYLKKISDDLTEYNPSHHYHDLVQFVLKLPASEQWLMLFPYQKLTFGGQNIDAFISLLEKGKSVSFILNKTDIAKYREIFLKSLESKKINEEQQKIFVTCYFPSQSIIKFCLKTTSNHPIQPEFSFGSTGIATRDRCHQNGKHPILIYSHFVKSNLTRAHNGDLGPFGALVHDMSHTFWGGLLPVWFRNLIFSHLRPVFNQFKTKAIEYRDHEMVALIEATTTDWSDFDLLGFGETFLEDKRLIVYLRGGLTYYENIIQNGNYLFTEQKKTFQAIGDNHFHRLYYLVLQYKYSVKEWTDQQLMVWDKIITLLENLITSCKDSDPILTALQCLVKNSAADCNDELQVVFDDSIEWQKWLRILFKHKESIDIWTIVKDNHHNELLSLITKHHLAFFHPYVPLTTKKHSQLLNLVMRQTQMLWSKEKALRAVSKSVQSQSTAITDNNLPRQEIGVVFQATKSRSGIEFFQGPSSWSIIEEGVDPDEMTADVMKSKGYHNNRPLHIQSIFLYGYRDGTCGIVVAAGHSAQANRYLCSRQNIQQLRQSLQSHGIHSTTANVVSFPIDDKNIVFEMRGPMAELIHIIPTIIDAVVDVEEQVSVNSIRNDIMNTFQQPTPGFTMS